MVFLSVACFLSWPQDLCMIVQVVLVYLIFRMVNVPLCDNTSILWVMLVVFQLSC